MDALHDIHDLQVGAWYALIDVEFSACAAPLAEYVGNGEFADDDLREFRAADFDYFVRN